MVYPFNSLTPAEMDALSTHLIGPDSPIKAVPEVAVLQSQIMEAHQDIKACQKPVPGIDPVWQELTDTLEAKDVTYDALAKTVDGSVNTAILWPLAQDPPDEARVKECEELRAEVFATGMKIVNGTYLEEAGHTDRLEERLAKNARAGSVLQSIPVAKDVTCLDVTQRWIGVGKEMGKLVNQRAAHVPPETVKVISVKEAKVKWVRVMNAVMNALDLSKAPAAAIQAVRQPLLDASERAAARAAAVRRRTKVTAG